MNIAIHHFEKSYGNAFPTQCVITNAAAVLQADNIMHRNA
jgi:hypothetical protein